MTRQFTKPELLTSCCRHRMRLADKFLYTMILRIRHVKIASRIECHAPRIAELAGFAAGTTDNLDRLIVGIEHLDAAVAEFAHVLPAVFIHADIIRIAEFTGRSAGPAMAAQKFAFAGVNLDPMIARIGHVEIVVRIDAQSFGPVEIIRTLAALAE